MREPKRTAELDKISAFQAPSNANRSVLHTQRQCANLASLRTGLTTAPASSEREPAEAHRSSGSRSLQAERATGLRGEALQRRRVHLGAGPQDEPADTGGGVGVDRRRVGDVEARRGDADLERAQLGRTLHL